MTKSAGMSVRIKDDGPWTMVEYGERLFSMGGNLFGPRTAMFKLAISVACLDVLAQDVSKPPIQLRRITPQGSEVVLPKDHPAAALLKNGPNPYMGIHEFLRTATYQLAIFSEYFIAARRFKSLELMEFCGIGKDKVSEATVNVEARKWYYDIQPSSRHDQALFGWAKGMRSNKEVAHIRRRSINGFDVLSTASLSSNALNLLCTMQDYQSGIYQNGGVPKLAFTFPDGLTDDQFDKLQKGIDKALKKSQTDGTPVILEGKDGIVPKIEKLSESTGDKDFIKSNMNAAMDVIRYYRVPPHKVYLMESIKYDNMDSAERVYVNDTLCSYFIDIQDGLNRALLTEAERNEYYFEFDEEQAFALNPAERNEITEKRWKSGMITYDEMRRGIKHNTVGGDKGKYRTFSGNFVMVDDNNEVIMRAGGNKPEDDASTPKKPKTQENTDA